MARSCVALFLLSGVLIALGCSPRTLVSDCHRCVPVEKRGPKTLFEWAECKEEPEEDDSKADNGNEKNGSESTKESKNGQESKNGEGSKGNSTGEKKPKNGNGASEEPEEPDEIATDRPDFTETSTTVGRGRIQLETGYTYTRDRANGSRLTAHSYPEALLRIGLFAEWFELRIGQNFASEQTTMPDGTVESVSGAEDLYLGVKLALTEQQKVLPEMAVVLQMTVPSGAQAFSADEVLPGINWLYGWDVVPDCLTFAGSTQVNRVRGSVFFPVFDGFGLPLAPLEGKHSYLEIAQSLTVGYILTQQLGAYTEWFALFPHSALEPDVGLEHYLNGGFTYKCTPNTQIDVRAGVGLNERADDLFAGTGFSFRY